MSRVICAPSRSCIRCTIPIRTRSSWITGPLSPSIRAWGSAEYLTWLHANDYPLSAVEEIITGTKDSDGVYSEYPAYRDARRPPALLMLRRTYDLGVPPMRCRGVHTADWPAVPVCCTVLPRSGDLNTERKFPSDKVYRPDDRGIVGVESFGPQGGCVHRHPHQCWTCGLSSGFHVRARLPWPDPILMP